MAFFVTVRPRTSPGLSQRSEGTCGKVRKSFISKAPGPECY